MKTCPIIPHRFRPVILASLILAVVAAAAQDENCLHPLARGQLRATLELTDGSRLVGKPLEKTLPFYTEAFGTREFSNMAACLDLLLDKIRQFEICHKDKSVVIKFRNGDQLTGAIKNNPMPQPGSEPGDYAPDSTFPIQTILGNLKINFDQIDRITFSVPQEGELPPGDGLLKFGNVNWTPWRTMFEVQGDKLVTLPKARPGFNYGHWGNGRSPTLVTNIGNPDWKDYRVEFELGMTGVSPALNPHGLPADYRSCGISFHVTDSKESWNEKGESSYGFGIAADGSWSLACNYNHYSPSATGWSQPLLDGARTLARGKGLKIDTEKGNKIRLDVIGTRIQIWVDDERIVDIGDEKMVATIGGQTLDHGGIAISWGWECMGWIRNFSAKQL